MIACGALAAEVRALACGEGLPVEVHALPPRLHNRPGEIAPAVGELAERLLVSGGRVAVAYADCGTYGALDAVCARLGLERLPGLHCYDLIAGASTVAALLEEEAGTYLLTDFLVASFRRLVVRELGLDRRPELARDYFAHYRRLVWLRQRDDEALVAEASYAAELLGLPLEVRMVGRRPLELALSALCTGCGHAA